MSCAIITGGSRGIGKAVAVALAKDGYNIILGYNNSEEKASAVAEEITALGVECVCIKGDISAEQTAIDTVKTAVDKFGQIDLLVNNAGITRDGLLLRMKTDDFTNVLNANLTGTFNMSREAAKVMAKARKGCIVNISSVVGEVGNSGQCNYASSKAGVIGLTKSLAKELAPRNIRVNAVAPGFIETDMTASLNDGVKDQAVKAIPLSRFGRPEDVANAVCFLASEKASYITGQIINVCGGMVI